MGKFIVQPIRALHADILRQLLEVRTIHTEKRVGTLHRQQTSCGAQSISAIREVAGILFWLEMTWTCPIWPTELNVSSSPGADTQPNLLNGGFWPIVVMLAQQHDRPLRIEKQNIAYQLVAGPCVTANRAPF